MIGIRNNQYLYQRSGNHQNLSDTVYCNNVLFWTLLFSIPFTLIIDLLFAPNILVILTTVRIITAFIALKIHQAKNKKKIQRYLNHHLSIGIFLYTSVSIFLFVPEALRPIYFFLLCLTGFFVHIVWRVNIAHSLTSSLIVFSLILCSRKSSSIAFNISDALIFLGVSTAALAISLFHSKKAVSLDSPEVDIPHVHAKNNKFIRGRHILPRTSRHDTKETVIEIPITTSAAVSD